MDEEVEDEEEDKGLIFDDDDWVLLDAGFEEADFEINSDLRVGCLLKLGFWRYCFWGWFKKIFWFVLLVADGILPTLERSSKTGLFLGGPRALFLRSKSWERVTRVPPATDAGWSMFCMNEWVRNETWKNNNNNNKNPTNLSHLKGKKKKKRLRNNRIERAKCEWNRVTQ